MHAAGIVWFSLPKPSSRLGWLGEAPNRRRVAPRCPERQPLLAAIPLLAALLALGCGDDSGVGRTFPVTGSITLDDQPLVAKSTVVLFKPDGAKGNASEFEPTGTVDGQGRYALFTKGKKGAPPGWYKVTVTAHEGRSEHPKGKGPHRPVARVLVPGKYGQPELSDLSIEVVENPPPGAYDLRLTTESARSSP
jgi:hypothetical protein